MYRDLSKLKLESVEKMSKEPTFTQVEDTKGSVSQL